MGSPRDTIAKAIRHNETLLLINLYRAHKALFSSWAPAGFDEDRCWERLAGLGFGLIDIEAADLLAAEATLADRRVEL